MFKSFRDFKDRLDARHLANKDMQNDPYVVAVHKFIRENGLTCYNPNVTGIPIGKPEE